LKNKQPTITKNHKTVYLTYEGWNKFEISIFIVLAKQRKTLWKKTWQR